MSRSLLLLSLCLSPLGAHAQDHSPAEVAELRQTIAEIVDVKATASAERIGWQERKASMTELLELHRKELELLDGELSAAGSSAGGFDEKKRQAEAEIARLKEVRRLARETVIRCLPRALDLVARLPRPLAEEAADEVGRLEAWESKGEPREALQALLSLVSKAEQFNRRFTRAAEIHDGYEVEVLYLGLARAYYTDRSGNAGVGVPGASGWTWSSRPGLEGEIVKAFDELDRKRPPELVRLPVEIMEEP